MDEDRREQPRGVLDLVQNEERLRFNFMAFVANTTITGVEIVKDRITLHLDNGRGIQFGIDNCELTLMFYVATPMEPISRHKM